MPAPTDLQLPSVRVSGLDVWFGTRQVLHDLDLTVSPGRRTGLVGENGSGKSTLLRALAGTLPSRARRLGHGRRAGRRGDARPGAAVPRRRHDRRRPGRGPGAAAPDGRRRRAALGRPDRRGRRRRRTPPRWTSPSPTTPGTPTAARRSRPSGSASVRSTPTRRIGTLSGGQRTRLALATVMTTRPSCLLLDEPTNHLDDDAVDQLTAFLRDLPGVVVLASHDRVLLDDVCTDLFDLDPSDARHRRPGRAAVRRRLDGVRGAARGHATPLGGDVRRAAGGAGPAARRDAGSAPRRSPTTGRRATTTSTSTASRARTSTARSPAASGTRSGVSRSPSASRCASRGRRSSCGPT